MITTSRTCSPACSVAARASSRRMSAETDSGVCRSPWYSQWTSLLPISRLTSCATRSGAISAESLATRPTRTLSGDSKYTTDGVVSSPTAFFSTTARPASSIMATQE